MRSLLIREVLHRKGDKDNLVDGQLISEINPPKACFKDFQKKYQTNGLNVLDVFAGGGSIPFESARLGFNTFSSELNPVASLLQETIFNSIVVENFGEKLRSAGR